MIVAIHQPMYWPWLGFFKKIMNCDVFVFFDDVQYERKDWHNRNQIRTKNGVTWLKVPVKSHFDSKIMGVKIDNTKNWSQKHKKSIFFSYSKSIYFDLYKSFIEKLYEKNFDLLIDLNIEIIQFVMNQLKLKTKTIFSSELSVSQKGSDRILEICKALNADHYISGTDWAKDHLRVEDFEKKGITVEFQEFQHPVYKQPYKDFLPKMSIMDLLFNEGKNSREILSKSVTLEKKFQNKHSPTNHDVS